jgi:hypothetical protein
MRGVRRDFSHFSVKITGSFSSLCMEGTIYSYSIFRVNPSFLRVIIPVHT